MAENQIKLCRAKNGDAEALPLSERVSSILKVLSILCKVAVEELKARVKLVGEYYCLIYENEKEVLPLDGTTWQALLAQKIRVVTDGIVSRPNNPKLSVLDDVKLNAKEYDKIIECVQSSTELFYNAGLFDYEELELPELGKVSKILNEFPLIKERRVEISTVGVREEHPIAIFFEYAKDGTLLCNKDGQARNFKCALTLSQAKELDAIYQKDKAHDTYTVLILKVQEEKKGNGKYHLRDFYVEASGVQLTIE